MTVAITIDVTGIDAVIAAAGRVDGTAMRGPVQRVGDRYLQRLRDETPLGRGEQPGRLRAAYTTAVSASPFEASYHIENQSPHLRYVLNGRGPVTVKRAKALRFVIDGRVYFRRAVGPVAPNRFDERVAAAMQSDLAGLGDDLAAAVIAAYGQGGGTP